MEFHEVSNIFPLMTEEEYRDLKEDIKENGLLEPIWTYENQIIDGRNRYSVCKELGIEPKYRKWNGEDSLISFVISLNINRRHLTASQKAAVALEALPFLEKEARKRQKTSGPGILGGKPLPPQMEEAVLKEKPFYKEATAYTGKIFGVGRTYITEAKKLKKESPEKFKDIKEGKKTITQVKRELKEEKRESRREKNRELIKDKDIVADVNKIEAKFATIVIDPPWDWGDEGDVNQLGRAKPDYSTMSIYEISQVPVDTLADVDCHLYLWITNRSLPKGFALLEKWGFRYIVLLTWCKPSIGMGNYFRGSTEQILFGVKGSQPLKRKDVGTWFHAPRGKGHSTKPDEFYELVESCSPGPYIDIFAREPRKGWVVMGAEVKDEKKKS